MNSREAVKSGSDDPDRKRIAFLVAGGTGILALAFAYYTRTWQSFSTVRDICPVLFCDFVDYYFPMGAAMFRTGLPIDGYLYSAFIAVLLSVFPTLGIKASLVLWGFLQAVFVSVYVYLFRRLVRAELPIQMLFMILILTSYPLLLNLMVGQVSVFIIVPLMGMLLYYGRNRRAVGAGLLALSVSFKFFPIIFLTPYAARRDVRFLLLAAAACISMLFVIPGLLLGVDGILRFYGSILDAFRNSGWVDNNPHSQFLPHVALRLTGAAGDEAIRIFLILLTSGIAVTNMGLLILVQRAHLRHADLWSFQLICLTIPFILKTSWPHDLIFLPFTQAFLAWWLLEGERANPQTEACKERTHPHIWRLLTSNSQRALISALLLLSVLFSNLLFYDLVGNFVLFGQLAFLFWSDVFLLIASYMILLPSTLRQLRQVSAWN